MSSALQLLGCKQFILISNEKWGFLRSNTHSFFRKVLTAGVKMFSRSLTSLTELTSVNRASPRWTNEITFITAKIFYAELLLRRCEHCSVSQIFSLLQTIQI